MQAVHSTGLTTGATTPKVSRYLLLWSTHAHSLRYTRRLLSVVCGPSSVVYGLSSIIARVGDYCTVITISVVLYNLELATGCERRW